MPNFVTTATTNVQADAITNNPTAAAASMPHSVPDSHKFTISPLGLAVNEALSFEEWAALAPSFGTVLRSMAFVIGDWLVYGEDHFAVESDTEETPAASSLAKRAPRRVSRERYRQAAEATGLDAGTLCNYAHVSRKVEMSLRNEHLSWDHHRAVAKLPREEQEKWLALASQGPERVSTRRLRASISRGRLLSVEELSTPPAEVGVPNHIPPINRLCAWWNGAGGERWLSSRSVDQLDALLRDFAPLRHMIEAIESRAQSRRRAA